MDATTPAPQPSPAAAAPLLGQRIAFIGGGNMASAIIAALLRGGCQPGDITVVDPGEAARAQVRERFGVRTLEAASPALAGSRLAVWAVKPQTFREAAAAAAPHVAGALHLSVAAGIRCASMQAWLGSARIVRTMPNTPALVGQGMTGVYALPGVNAEDRRLAEALIAGTGRWVWVDDEAALDAVTALSGSGPAYVFYFLEAMREAGTAMGLPAAVALELAIGTFIGAARLAQDAGEPPEVLRERVTSKGGTTAAALAALEAAGVKHAFIGAMHAARQRAQELGDAFGA
ncbi:Pyrroline-5-carboxylate reductase [Tepidimonas thermarum]|uniref:Pyrroline-5-carboxylate reductase n=1 Tax=Tepidimonas thermarum TaxID=335431 RepID=A0A554X3M2_9BURK|nr:pyrroline-5-carboxylate reductase [Tepidimonas thermarum]TSE30444.1 Pyrroline-5-carboxylate reductase [Tepidimonas thermarum]